MHIPLSTYRIQVNKEFTFEQVESLIPYLKNLGIKELYLSPILQAQPDSMHGYDTIDYDHVSSNLGGMRALEQLSQTLKEYHLGLCVDIVPNHMAATDKNLYWEDVLKKGKSSSWSDLFDINWNNSKPNHLVYRRFFDINELVCLKTEHKKVFNWTHHTIIQLIKEKIITSLRVDHIDGLRRPLNYLRSLHQAIPFPFYIIAEKILGFNEQLPRTWPLKGTTGYDFLNELNQVFVNTQGLSCLNDYYNQVTANTKTIEELKITCLQQVMQTLFKNEFEGLCQRLQQLLNVDVHNLLLQFSSLMPVYRLYQQKSMLKFNEEVISQITRQIKNVDVSLLDLFTALLRDGYPDFFSQKQIKEWKKWRNDWEVFTGPVMAKGFEDTTCYNYYAFLAVNEVGSAPQYFISGEALKKFHQYNQYKHQYWPYSINATSTHDTKRSEDVRARINVLTELAGEWNLFLSQSFDFNDKKKVFVHEQLCPDVVDEILIYQSLMGIWPLFPQTTNIEQRMECFLIKACRERKSHTSWMSPNEAYEKGIIHFMKLILADLKFMADFLILQSKIAFFGMYNSLSQIILKTTCPGIPDFYQGNEAWTFNLVDPDNRAIINYEPLKKLDSQEPLVTLLESWQDGRIKFNLTKILLAIRNQYSSIFLHGDYIPIEIHGKKAKNIIAFVRSYRKQVLVVITCRWFSELVAVGKEWQTNYLSDEVFFLPGRFISLLSEKPEPITNKFIIKNLLKELPFCILKKID